MIKTVKIRSENINEKIGTIIDLIRMKILFAIKFGFSDAKSQNSSMMKH